jgi:flagellar biosynthesis/type III secretory pathway chaperone
MITSSNNQQQEIKQIMQKEVDCVHLLLKSLELEYEALADPHCATLEDIVRDKHEKIKQLEIVSKRREELLATFDIVIPDVGSNKVNNNKYYQFNDTLFDNGGQLAELWNELLNVAEQCRDKNRVNGNIVELASRQSRHALDILRGIAPVTSTASELYDNGLYNSRGQTKSFANKRTLVHV